MKINSEISRVRAALVNSGQLDFGEAERRLAASRLTVEVTEDASATIAGQAAALTAALTGSRCFGGVILDGAWERSLLVPLPFKGASLAVAARKLGVKAKRAKGSSRRIVIGPGKPITAEWSVRAVWNGWTAGICPGSAVGPEGDGSCALAGIAAGALAVGQAFVAEQGDPRAGRFSQTLSLWTTQSVELTDGNAGPMQFYAPDALWLAGLGNLGQAYLWALSMLPFPDPDKLIVFLQDDDEVKSENWGTSILVQRGRYGVLKTRMAEDWSIERGFRARRIDRRLDEHLRRGDLEPAILLAGFDRMAARKLLGHPGFEYVIDAGLGATVDMYRQFRLNVFDRDRDPEAHFDGVEDRTQQTIDANLRLPAYQDVALDDCGKAMLAGIPVAVPFVGTFVGAMAVAQALRIASGESPCAAIVGDAGDLRTTRSSMGPIDPRVRFGTVPLTLKG